MVQLAQDAAPAVAAAMPSAELLFLNVREAAELLRLDESTLYRHLREGRFPGVKVGGRYLVPARFVERLVDEAIATGRCVVVTDLAVATTATEGPVARSEASAEEPAA